MLLSLIMAFITFLRSLFQRFLKNFPDICFTKIKSQDDLEDDDLLLSRPTHRIDDDVEAANSVATILFTGKSPTTTAVNLRNAASPKPSNFYSSNLSYDDNFNSSPELWNHEIKRCTPSFDSRQKYYFAKDYHENAASYEKYEQSAHADPIEYNVDDEPCSAGIFVGAESSDSLLEHDGSELEKTEIPKPIHDTNAQVDFNNYNKGSGDLSETTIYFHSLDDDSGNLCNSPYTDADSLLSGRTSNDSDDTPRASITSSTTACSTLTRKSSIMKNIRDSKFRNLLISSTNVNYNTAAVKNLDHGAVTGDQNFIQCNHLYFATSVKGGPGSFTVVKYADSCLPIGNVSPVISGHRAAVIDFDFSPFDHHLVASCSEDATIKLWKMLDADQINTLNFSDENDSVALQSLSPREEIALRGHERKVYCAKFHPSVRSLLCSVSADGSSRLWNVETGTTMSCTGNNLYDTSYHDLVWGAAGSSYRVSSKDQRLHFIDARTSTVAAVVNKAHEGGRSIKLVSLWDDADRLLSVGCGKASMRQVKIWDPRHMQSEVFKLDLDTAPGVVMPFFDRCTGLLYLSGKGETSIRYYEVSAAADIQLLGDFKSSVPVKGLAMAPKKGLDVMSCEIGRFVKLTNSTVQTLPVVVPRQSLAFQDDLYPEIYSDIPPHTTGEWLEGSIEMPPTVSLKPVNYLPRRSSIPLSQSLRDKFFSRRTNSTPMKIEDLADEQLRADLTQAVRKANLRIFVLESRLRKANIPVND